MQMALSSLYFQDLCGVCVLFTTLEVTSELQSRVNHSAPTANKVFPHCLSVRVGAAGEGGGRVGVIEK